MYEALVLLNYTQMYTHTRTHTHTQTDMWFTNVNTTLCSNMSNV